MSDDLERYVHVVKALHFYADFFMGLTSKEKLELYELADEYEELVSRFKDEISVRELWEPFSDSD